jgi:leader peptidase (prepilin peptidase)/N-methyltransferase
MTPETLINVVFPIAAFVMGSCVGSFLNVVIYRVPLGLSVNEPKRSFCPNCKTQIPGWLNIPLVTWVMLGGKCKWCKKPISPRYFLVELLTAVCFLAAWQAFANEKGYGVAVAYLILLALLIAATFIDFD